MPGAGLEPARPLEGHPVFKAARSVPPYVARCRDAPSGAGSRRTGPCPDVFRGLFPTRRPPVNFGERMGMEDGRSIDTARHAGRASATASTRPPARLLAPWVALSRTFRKLRPFPATGALPLSREPRPDPGARWGARRFKKGRRRATTGLSKARPPREAQQGSLCRALYRRRVVFDLPGWSCSRACTSPGEQLPPSPARP
jgi:hypothetical protein